MNFAKAAPADAEKILAFYRSLITEDNSWDEEYPSMETIEYDLKNDGLYLLLDGSGIVSAVSIEFEDDIADMELPWSEGPFCIFARLGVKKEYQGKGIAKLMIENIKSEAKRRGYLFSRHLASAKDPVTSGMYDHLGYRYMGMTHMYGEDYKIYEGKL